jgi:hypothetical protein
MFKKMKTAALAASVSVFAALPALAQDSPVTTAANSFTSEFGTMATTIGTALLAAGFSALVFKWAKGMLFS